MNKLLSIFGEMPKLTYKSISKVFIDDILGINKYMHCSKSCILMALILIDRLQDENEDFRLTSKNIYKVFMVAIVIAAKIHDDAVYKNTYYSQISGFSAK